MRVLLADDEQLLIDTVATGLRELSMAVDVVHRGDDAIDRLSVTNYDVAVVDRDMPGMSGDDVCRWLAVNSTTTRVLMLTASAGIRDRVTGLALGADDYLVKPFAFAELAARIQALGRRPGSTASPVMRYDSLEVDVPRHSASRDGRLLILTPKEFAVLEILVRAQGGVVSAEVLLETAWDENTDPFTNAVRVVIMNLRKKLSPPAIIFTVSRIGYRLGQDLA